MDDIQFNELLINSNKSLTIPVDKCVLALNFLVARMPLNQELSITLFDASEATILIKAICAAVPAVIPYYQNHQNYLYRLLLNSPNSIYEVVNND